MRGVVWGAVFACVAFFACTPTKKQRRSLDLNVAVIDKKVAGAADGLSEGLDVSFEATKAAGETLYNAAVSLDAARNGCSLDERDDFEIGSLEEYYLGRALAAEQIAELQAQDLPLAHPVSQYVDKVGQYLALAAEEYGEQNVRERWKDAPERVVPNRPAPFTGYHFIVLERAEPNAFGGPGGAVMVTTGLLAQLQSEEELAAVLAHEIAHVQRGHGVEFLKAFMCQKAAQDKAFAPARNAAARGRELKAAMPKGSVLRDATEQMLSSLMDSVSEQAKALFKVGYPRAFELEADRIALRYMELAGYDPDAMQRLFERLRQQASGQRRQDEYGTTHPKFSTRLEVIRPVLATIGSEQRPRQEALSARKLRFGAVMSRLLSTQSARGSRGSP